ncbi:MAG: secretory lipase precursor [Candidatus Eremiobacteraeota bacterium]|nr:secretory lipase precursor [Candidatus Eremiobacteraeota bacterium]
MIASLLSFSALLAAAIPSGPAGNAFYTPPSPLPAATHGDVIWARPLTTAAALPSAASNTLVLYHTTSAAGADRAVSGTVAIPKGAPPAGGWPVISWAHGTTGDAPACTPSLDTPAGVVHDYLGPIAATLDKAVAQGYAVVQTDYEGQGTPGVHPYLVGVAEAHDTIDMVRAARALEPRLGSRWVAMGHSQGGHAVLFTSAVASTWAPELQLLGGVAEAPAAFVSPFITSLTKGTSATPSFAFGALFIAAAASVDPSVKLDQILAPAALAMVPHLTDRCSGALYRPDSWGGLIPASSFRSDADFGPLLRFAAQNDAAALHPGVPLFIAHGSTDTTVPKTSSDALDKALCANGATVRYDVYQGLGHRPVVPASLNDALEWVGARFAGRPAPSNCGAAPTLHGP